MINSKHGVKFWLIMKCTLIVLVIFSISAIAQTKTERIDELMNRYYSNGQFNGNILVSENGKIIYINSFGYADLEWEIPNTPDTKFRIASMTKPFTSLLVLQYIEQGKINLNGYITDYIPDFPPAMGDVITINPLR